MFTMLTKALAILVVFLCGYIGYLEWRNNSLESSVKSLTEQYQLSINVAQNNQKTIEQLEKELKERPVQYIEITKNVFREVCQGEQVVSAIKAIPSKTQPIVKEGYGETSELNIDSKLPDDLLRMLQ